MGDGAMAPTTDESRRVELGLKAIEAVLRDLPTVASTWSSMSEDERVVWSMEWGNEMSRLRQLDEDGATGHLTSEQARRCRALVERVRAAQASIVALGLRGPSLSDDSPAREELHRASG